MKRMRCDTVHDAMNVRRWGLTAASIHALGVAAAGHAGARRALEILSDEIRRTMQLCGIGRFDDIGPGLLAPR